VAGEQSGCPLVIDLVLTDNRTRIALEVDGPTHTARVAAGGAHVQTGSTALRDWCLRQLGFRVLSVDFRKWAQQRGAPVLADAFARDQAMLRERLLACLDADRGGRDADGIVMRPRLTFIPP